MANRERTEAARAMRPRTPRDWHGRKWGAERVAAWEEEMKQIEEARKAAAAEVIQYDTLDDSGTQTTIVIGRDDV